MELCVRKWDQTADCIYYTLRVLSHGILGIPLSSWHTQQWRAPLSACHHRTPVLPSSVTEQASRPDIQTVAICDWMCAMFHFLLWLKLKCNYRFWFCLLVSYLTSCLSWSVSMPVWRSLDADTFLEEVICNPKIWILRLTSYIYSIYMCFHT